MDTKRGSISVCACVAVSLLATLAASSAFSQTTVLSFGRITEARTPSSGLASDYKRASRFTVSSRGILTELCAYLDGKGGATGTQQARLVLYTDVSGAPGKKVFDGDPVFVSSGDAARWVCMHQYGGTFVPPYSPYPFQPGAYWIALQTSGQAGVIRDFGDGAANWYGNSDAFADGASSTFGTGKSGSGTLSFFAKYIPDSQARAAGRTTIGAYPSSPMTDDYKRASSFVMPERGRLYMISGYMDAFGMSNSDVEDLIRYAIYKDANGVPNEKVYESIYGYGLLTAPGRWIADLAQPSVSKMLEPGRYWIAIVTGYDYPSKWMRYFTDGTPGNWYGNADDTSDGAASDPFGPGTKGNGTISAFILYRPGAVTTGQLGRADIATKASSALKSDTIRWSEFRTNDLHATLTGLNAYLDGLGATAGSQQVRMVIYGKYDEVFGYHYKLAESAVVSIPAGMKPQWVHFSVPAVELESDSGFGSYLIGIQTGGPASVARDYTDGRFDPQGNWYSLPDEFADGAWDRTPYTRSGAGTLSVYATYSLPSP